MSNQFNRFSRDWATYSSFLGCVGVLLASNQSGHGQALMASGAIDLKGNTLKGNNIATDSFDSSAPDYPGYWTNWIRKAGGDVVTCTTPTNFDLGHASIAGHVRTGPGGGVGIGLSNSVGDLAWVGAATPGVEPGWLSEDANVVFKNIVIPGPPGSIWVGAPGSGNVTIFYYSEYFISHSFAHVITSSGNYTINDSGDVYVATNCTVNLKVISSVGTFAPNILYAAGAGTNAARVTCYVDCTNCIVGADTWTQSGLAQNMVFLGTTNCASLAYKGNGNFAGVLYFPEASLQLAGGGSIPIDFMGSIVVKTIKVNGYYDFHFDEALYRQGLPMLLFGAPAQNFSILVGQDASLKGSAVGAQPLCYQWRLGGSDIPDATNSSLSLTNIQLTNAGLYEVVVTNISGSVTSQVQLAVYDSFAATLQSPIVSTDGVFQVSVAGISNFNYALEVSSNLADWVPILTNASPFSFNDTKAVLSPQQFYRAVYVP